MANFGFEPATEDNASRPCDGYAVATVYLGDHSETVHFWPKLWSADDYVEHWRATAEALLSGHAPALFCTDYSQISCTCFVGWRSEQAFVFEEWIVKHGCLVRDGLRLSLIDPDRQPCSDASHFFVSADDVQAFVRSQS